MYYALAGRRHEQLTSSSTADQQCNNSHHKQMKVHLLWMHSHTVHNTWHHALILLLVSWTGNVWDAVGYGDCSERNELQYTFIALLEYNKKIRSKLWVNLKMVTIVNTQIGFKPITILIGRANQWNLAVCTYSATNWVFNDFLSSKTVEEVVKLISRYFHGRKYVIRALRTIPFC